MDVATVVVVVAVVGAVAVKHYKESNLGSFFIFSPPSIKLNKTHISDYFNLSIHYNSPVQLIERRIIHISVNQLSNQLKSQAGHTFNKDIKQALFNLIDLKIIEDVQPEYKLALPGYGYFQYQPDFKITINKHHVIFIDNTKTIRTDRVKQKQWEANGVKLVYEGTAIKVEYFIIVPTQDSIGNQNTRFKEINLVEKEKRKIQLKEYYSQVDAILYVDEFIQYLYNIHYTS